MPPLNQKKRVQSTSRASGSNVTSSTSATVSNNLIRLGNNYNNNNISLASSAFIFDAPTPLSSLLGNIQRKKAFPDSSSAKYIISTMAAILLLIVKYLVIKDHSFPVHTLVPICYLIFTQLTGLDDIGALHLTFFLEQLLFLIPLILLSLSLFPPYLSFVSYALLWVATMVWCQGSQNALKEFSLIKACILEKYFNLKNEDFGSNNSCRNAANSVKSLSSLSSIQSIPKQTYIKLFLFMVVTFFPFDCFFRSSSSPQLVIPNYQHLSFTGVTPLLNAIINKPFTTLSVLEAGKPFVRFLLTLYSMTFCTTFLFRSIHIFVGIRLSLIEYEKNTIKNTFGNISRFPATQLILNALNIIAIVIVPAFLFIFSLYFESKMRISLHGVLLFVISAFGCGYDYFGSCLGLCAYNFLVFSSSIFIYFILPFNFSFAANTLFAIIIGCVTAQKLQSFLGKNIPKTLCVALKPLIIVIYIIIYLWILGNSKIKSSFRRDTIYNNHFINSYVDNDIYNSKYEDKKAIFGTRLVSSFNVIYGLLTIHLWIFGTSSAIFGLSFLNPQFQTSILKNCNNCMGNSDDIRINSNNNLPNISHTKDTIASSVQISQTLNVNKKAEESKGVLHEGIFDQENESSNGAKNEYNCNNIDLENSGQTTSISEISMLVDRNSNKIINNNSNSLSFQREVNILADHLGKKSKINKSKKTSKSQKNHQQLQSPSIMPNLTSLNINTLENLEIEPSDNVSAYALMAASKEEEINDDNIEDYSNLQKNEPDNTSISSVSSTLLSTEQTKKKSNKNRRISEEKSFKHSNKSSPAPEKKFPLFTSSSIESKNSPLDAKLAFSNNNDFNSGISPKETHHNKNSQPIGALTSAPSTLPYVASTFADIVSGKNREKDRDNSDDNVESRGDLTEYNLANGTEASGYVNGSKFIKGPAAIGGIDEEAENKALDSILPSPKNNDEQADKMMHNNNNNSNDGIDKLIPLPVALGEESVQKIYANDDNGAIMSSALATNNKTNKKLGNKESNICKMNVVGSSFISIKTEEKEKEEKENEIENQEKLVVDVDSLKLGEYFPKVKASLPKINQVNESNDCNYQKKDYSNNDNTKGNISTKNNNGNAEHIKKQEIDVNISSTSTSSELANNIHAARSENLSKRSRQHQKHQPSTSPLLPPLSSKEPPRYNLTDLHRMLLGSDNVLPADETPGCDTEVSFGLLSAALEKASVASADNNHAINKKNNNNLISLPRQSSSNDIQILDAGYSPSSANNVAISKKDVNTASTTTSSNITNDNVNNLLKLTNITDSFSPSPNVAITNSLDTCEDPSMKRFIIELDKDDDDILAGNDNTNTVLARSVNSTNPKPSFDKSSSNSNVSSSLSHSQQRQLFESTLNASAPPVEIKGNKVIASTLNLGPLRLDTSGPQIASGAGMDPSQSQVPLQHQMQQQGINFQSCAKQIGGVWNPSGQFINPVNARGNFQNFSTSLGAQAVGIPVPVSNEKLQLSQSQIATLQQQQQQLNLQQMQGIQNQQSMPLHHPQYGFMDPQKLPQQHQMMLSQQPSQMTVMQPISSQQIVQSNYNISSLQPQQQQQILATMERNKLQQPQQTVQQPSQIVFLVNYSTGMKQPFVPVTLANGQSAFCPVVFAAQKQLQDRQQQQMQQLLLQHQQLEHQEIQQFFQAKQQLEQLSLQENDAQTQQANQQRLQQLQQILQQKFQRHKQEIQQMQQVHQQEQIQIQQQIMQQLQQQLMQEKQLQTQQQQQQSSQQQLQTQQQQESSQQQPQQPQQQLLQQQMPLLQHQQQQASQKQQPQQLL